MTEELSTHVPSIQELVTYKLLTDFIKVYCVNTYLVNSKN